MTYLNLPTPLPRRAPGWLRTALVAVMLGLLAAAPGCSEPEVQKAQSGPAPVAYTGPDHFRGTVKSLCRLRNYEPMLVSGYGVVVGLDNTGSSEVPSYLRQHMVNYLSKMGVGSARFDGVFKHMSPTELLQRKDTALVAVYGLIPPGAVPGTGFDVLVEALPQTQTTSLAGGRLMSTDLSIGGASKSLQYTRTRARARGPIYVSPFDSTAQTNADSEGEAAQSNKRRALVVTGGVTTRRRRIELILNQPSWLRSSAIADRINERFAAASDEKIQTASAQTDRVIRLKVPRRFASEPTRLIELIAHLYAQRGTGFEPDQARRLAKALENNPDDSRNIVLAWHALGRTIVKPVLREYYGHQNTQVSLAALEAGARLGDERASRRISDLATHDDVDVRIRAAEALVHLPKSRRGGRTLRRLLNDDVRRVRIAAYESLALTNNQQVIDRLGVRNRNGDLKFVVDRVPAERPLIYITHEHAPRIVLFKPDLGFESPVFARHWDNRLMLRRADGEGAGDGAGEGDGAQGPRPLEMYYMPRGQSNGKTFKLANATAATLIFGLGHESSAEMPGPGLGLSYGQTVDALYHFAKQGAIRAPIEVNTSPLAQLIDDHRTGDTEQPRPETGPARTQPAGGGSIGAAPNEPRPTGSNADTGSQQQTRSGSGGAGDSTRLP